MGNNITYPVYRNKAKFGINLSGIMNITVLYEIVGRCIIEIPRIVLRPYRMIPDISNCGINYTTLPAIKH